MVLPLRDTAAPSGRVLGPLGSGPARSCTWTSKSSATSPTAEAGGSWGACRGNATRLRLRACPATGTTAPSPAMRSSTPSWTTTPGSSTPRSTTTRPPTPRPQCCAAPRPGSPPAAPHRTSPVRQRQLLPVQPLAPDLRRARHHPEADPALSSADQRQDRTLPPDPCRRLGVQDLLSLRGRSPRRAARR